jgi:ubiquitin carboxyl-terminal hydrolase 4/11/15
MYKSTVTCPVCDKVSIIFDPFNTLTLQLPIENNWSKEVYFFPLHHRPIRVDVDIDKNASIRALKEFVAKRVGCEPERMIMAESYKSKFYRMFDDVTAISEANIQSGDIICLYEVESVPTNYDPKKQKKTTFYSSKEKDEIPDVDSPAADRLLVPIFNRVVKSSTSRQRTFFGEPCYVVITREDANSYDGVLRKVLGKVATMTTKNILDEDILSHPSITTPEDPDTVVMHDDDHSSDSNPIQTASVDGEDGFVDVSMKNTVDGRVPASTPQKSPAHSVLEPGSFIPPILQNLFQIKVVTSGELIPLGLNQIDEHKAYTSVSERASRQLPHRPASTTNLLEWQTA